MKYYDVEGNKTSVYCSVNYFFRDVKLIKRLLIGFILEDDKFGRKYFKAMYSNEMQRVHDLNFIEVGFEDFMVNYLKLNNTYVKGEDNIIKDGERQGYLPHEANISNCRIANKYDCPQSLDCVESISLEVSMW